jgi:hypothetical protein
MTAARLCAPVREAWEVGRPGGSHIGSRRAFRQPGKLNDMAPLDARSDRLSV